MEPIASIIITGDGLVIHLSGKMGNDDVFPMIDSRLTHDSAVDAVNGAAVSTAAAGMTFSSKEVMNYVRLVIIGGNIFWKNLGK